MILGANAVQAHAVTLLNFDFTLTGEPGLFGGTVTGEVIGLEDNASSAPTDIIITSAPLRFGLTTPYDFGTSFQSEGSITVANGEVTGLSMLNFNANSPAYAPTPGSTFKGVSIGFGDSLNGTFFAYNGDTAIINNAGGVTFSPAAAVATTPEPSSWALLIFGMCILVWLRKSFLADPRIDG